MIDEVRGETLMGSLPYSGLSGLGVEVLRIGEEVSCRVGLIPWKCLGGYDSTGLFSPVLSVELQTKLLRKVSHKTSRGWLYKCFPDFLFYIPMKRGPTGCQKQLSLTDTCTSCHPRDHSTFRFDLFISGLLKV